MLWKSPGFTAVAVAILALGSGANTAVFSVLNAVVLRPLPYSDPDRLYVIQSTTSKEPGLFSAPDLATWRERTQVFERMAAADPRSRILSGVDEPEQLTGVAVGLECLPLLGTPPIRGRWFSEEDFGAGAPQSVIIGQRLWLRRFRGDPNVLGKTILLSGTGHSIIGIMSSEFQFVDKRAEFWLPLQFSSEELSNRDRQSFTVYARAKGSATRLQVEAEARMVSQALVQQFPKEHENWRATVTPLRDTVAGEIRPTLFLLFGAVAFVLLIACLNEASLLLAIFAGLAVVLAAAGVHGVVSYTVSQQRHEIGIRMALGAQNRKIIGEIAARGFRYVLIGIAFGLAAALVATRLLSMLLFEVKPTDPATYFVASAFLLAWTMAAIWLPARRATKVDPLVALRDE